MAEYNDGRAMFYMIAGFATPAMALLAGGLAVYEHPVYWIPTAVLSVLAGAFWGLYRRELGKLMSADEPKVEQSGPGQDEQLMGVVTYEKLRRLLALSGSPIPGDYEGREGPTPDSVADAVRAVSDDETAERVEQMLEAWYRIDAIYRANPFTDYALPSVDMVEVARSTLYAAETLHEMGQLPERD